MTPQFKDIIQFVAGDKRGLIAQVLSVGDDGVRCCARDMSGQARLFTVPNNDEFKLTGGVALLRFAPRFSAVN